MIALKVLYYICSIFNKVAVSIINILYAYMNGLSIKCLNIILRYNCRWRNLKCACNCRNKEKFKKIINEHLYNNYSYEQSNILKQTLGLDFFYSLT